VTCLVRLAQLGAGNVGREVARLVTRHRSAWVEAYDLDVRYVALWDSTGGLLDAEGMGDRELTLALEAKEAGRRFCHLDGGIQGSADALLKELWSEQGITVIDCSVGDGSHELLTQSLKAGGHAVLSNKAPLAVPQDRYDVLTTLGRAGSLRYEATVGAGLPVISTLRSLLDAGDEVIEIQACASGTLGYITSELMAGRRYSDAVRRARELGYTEPDPRDDLSGLDVARKALILARTFGRRLELADVCVEPLLPAFVDPGLRVDEFLEALPEADREFAEKVERARRGGNSLKYVATIPASGQVRVALEEAPAHTQMGSLTGPDNIFVFCTREYREYPLTVIGPGAGATVTAMGVIDDVLRAARQVRP
jgi:homoserine dehydrogenase